MSRWEYWLRILACVACIFLYAANGGDEIMWLFAATWGLVHLRADEIMAELKKASHDEA